ncbi:hypothetical protein EMPS_05236 [Entomortierella parvispora]|uniref:Uncharacterized protein n=1 Tax=Entomortierella parvispora TaxID=205924 RepID=A0A9P3LW99_9FUNG|nr:hypothetical protein EMPS_05236 [Entomortierella parvispora]
MPQLLLAVPLGRTWFGTRYWKTPSLMDLPVELEYIPYPELEARFTKLNKIAQRVYPTPRPNIIALVLFSCLFVAAAVGVARAGRSSAPSLSAFQIMAQSACFILPVLIILWIRLRKDSNVKARKLFKRRSLKLLRTWTSQDSVTHAMQWKLRQRPRSLVNQWTLEGLPQQEQIELDQHHHQRELQQDDDRGSIEVQETGNGDPDVPSDQTAVAALPTNVDPTVTLPRRTADVYSALRSPISISAPPPAIVLMMTPSQLQQEQSQLQPSPDSHQVQSSSAVIATSNLAARPAPDHRSTWEPWKDLFKDLSCCAFFFREAKVWVIEISIREGVADEYALPVPSPVYCDYRLPEYDVVMGLQSAGTMTVAGLSAGVTPSTRYVGQPPAYESDSDDDSGNDEDADMDDEDHDDDSTHTTTESSVSSLPQEQLQQLQQSHQAVEMTSIGGGSVIVEMTSMTTVASSTTLASSLPAKNSKDEEVDPDNSSKDPRTTGSSSHGGGKRQGIEE